MSQGELKVVQAQNQAIEDELKEVKREHQKSRIRYRIRIRILSQVSAR